MLKGEKVILRPWKRTDIESRLRWFNDPDVTQYTDTYLPMTEMTAEKWIEDLATDGTGAGVVFVIEVINEDNRHIGSIGLGISNSKDHNAEFGIVIGEKSHWEKGYGTEATRLILDYGFRQLNLHRISSTVFAFNQRSIRMHRTVGFAEEVRQREAIFINGEYHDKILFGLLRDEWEKL